MSWSYATNTKYIIYFDLIYTQIIRYDSRVLSFNILSYDVSRSLKFLTY